MNTNASYDVLVIGGGASGLAAAITAARAGKSVCIVERDVACGLKLLATGNGRCNLSNESIDFQRYNHPAFRRIRHGPPPRTRAYGFLLLAGHHDDLRGGPAVSALPSCRIGARCASQRLQSPGYHLDLWSKRCLGIQSPRGLGTPNRPSRASTQGKKARRPKIGGSLASEGACRHPSQERDAAGKGRNYRYGRQPRRHREDVQSFPHTAASRPLPCVGIGLRRPDCAQDAGWPARPRPFDAHPQSRGALARRRRSALPNLWHFGRCCL